MSAIAAAVFCFILGFLSAGVGVSAMIRLRQVQGWPKTQGIIRKIEVKGIDEDRVDIKYSYRVQGREYEGERWCIPFNFQPDAEAVVKRYPVGTQVRVLYDPDKPKDSTINVSSIGSTILFISVGILFMAFAFLIPSL